VLFGEQGIPPFYIVMMPSRTDISIVTCYGEHQIFHTSVILNEVKDLACSPNMTSSLRFFGKFILSAAKGLRTTTINCFEQDL